MNERLKLKKLAEQAGGIWSKAWGCFMSGTLDLERFAELVRQDERAKCAADYLQDCCEAARLEEREACAALLESRKTTAGSLADAVRDMEAAAIRARGEK